MDPKQSKRFIGYSKFFAVMSWVAVAMGIMTVAITPFSIREIGWIPTIIIAMTLVIASIVTTAIARSAAKEAKELS